MKLRNQFRITTVLLTILITLKTIILGATNCECPGNLITNPSFENGTNSWTHYNGNLSTSSFGAQCGNSALHFQHTSGSAGFYQVVTGLLPGTNLALSFYAGVHDNSKDQRFGIRYLNSSGVQIKYDSVNVNGPLPNMQFYTLTSTIPTNIATIRIEGITNGDWLKMDMICLTITSVCNPDNAAAPPFCAPSPICETSNFLWKQDISTSDGTVNVRFFCGGPTTFTIPGPYPSSFANAVVINISDVVSYDGYIGRNTVTQPNEKWRIKFKKNGSTVAYSSFTSDVPDLQTQGYWRGSLGSVSLPNGTDEIILEHWSVNNDCNSPNSVVPVSVCFNATPVCTNFKTVILSDLNLVKTRTIQNQISCGSEPDRAIYMSCLLDNISGGTEGNRKLWKIISGGNFTEYCDGIGYGEFTIQNVSLPTYKFDVKLIFTGRTYSPPPGNPHIEGCTSSSNSDWYYYTTMNGEMTGLETLSGAVLSLNLEMAAFQIGTNGSLYGTLGNFGASGWFDYTILMQPTGFLLESNCQSDFNFFLTGGQLTSTNAGKCEQICSSTSTNLKAVSAGGKPNYSYTWSSGLGNGQSKTVSPATTTTYTVTATDANGCTAKDDVIITVNPNPTVSINKTDAKCNLNNGSATATASGGTSPYSYLWSNGQTSQTINNLGVGTYTVTATDSKGCKGTASVVINNINGPTVNAGQDQAICLGSSANISATANGGTSPYSYTWSNGLGNGQSKTVSPTTTTTYTVTATDANGCTAKDDVIITVNPNPTVSINKTDAKCNLNNGSATATASGGTSPYSYLWSNGQTTQTINNLGVGTYTVTATDSKGCKGTASVVINNINGPTVNAGQDQAICLGSSANISATANGGTSPYSYTWSNGLGNGQSKTVSPTTTTTYTVTATDANGCTAKDDVIITVNPNPTVSINKTDAKCNLNNGSATASASGGTSPYSYLWSNGQTSQTINNLGVGTYTVTATDSKGCKGTASVVINNINGPTVHAGQDQEICLGSSANISATANGGTAPYTYSWSNGLGNGQSKTVSPTTTTTYTVTATDANGCTAKDDVIVTVNPNPTVSINKTDAKCNLNNGSATASASGGTSPYSYLWSNGQTSQTINNLGVGTYTVTATDSKGCKGTASVVINNINGPTVHAGQDQEICLGSSANISATANGGTSPYSYTWSNGLGNGQSKTVSPTTTTTFTVTVTDANGCTEIDYVKVTVIDCSPKITHEKTLASVTNVGLNTYNVVYHILVKNTGFAGTYDLSDKAAFDDDILINSVNFSSNAPGNPGFQLNGNGPWKLADNQAIFANSSHLYVISFNVRIDLSSTSSGNNVYFQCGRSFNNKPVAGEALFNESLLDLNDDGQFEERDTACADIPYIEHFKTINNVLQVSPRSFQVSYLIQVINKGGKADKYSLIDRSAFDNDISILSAKFNSNAPNHPANPGNVNLNNVSPWILATNQIINPGSVQTYNVIVDISIDLDDARGDNRYDQCGRSQLNYPISNEGLFNESQLDINSDGSIDQKDTACADVPYIVHEKITQNIIDQGNGNYKVVYKIDVINKGGGSGKYNLLDEPGFDNDFEIQNANYTTNAIGNPGNPNPKTLNGSGPWILASNQNIGAFMSQQYYLTVDVRIDLSLPESQGDEIYTSCGSKITGIPSSGEGLFNQTSLDVNIDGITDQRDSTCFDIEFNICSLGDFVWHDRNANGKQEIGEEGVLGIPVYLYDAITNKVVKSTVTNQNGFYLFDKILCGRFYVKFVPDNTWIVTKPNSSDDSTDSDVDNSNGPGTTKTIILNSGEDNRTVDLGLWKCSSIEGRVFLDSDLNGIFNVYENGINGLEVYLINAMTGAQVSKVLTKVKPSTPSDDGYYKFVCVEPGMYYVRFERLKELAASDPHKGIDNVKDSDIGHQNGVNTTGKITVFSDSTILNIGAGFQYKAMVGDFVWLDANVNGIQDAGEQPLENVHVYAVRPNGTVVSESMTKADGTYTLDGIAQGDYFVKFEPPISLGFTTPNQGSDLINSDVDGVNGYGTTRTYRIIAGDERPTIDAGLIFQVLPLDWLSFEGKYNGNYTELEWKTGNEINNDHFEVERRHESETSFRVIENIDATEDRSSQVHVYYHNDYNVVMPGIYYYRIKQVDKNGIYTHSKVISIRVNQSKEMTLSVHPNPTDESLTVDLGMSEDSELEVRVFDETGKNVFTNPFGGYRKAGFYREHINTTVLSVGQYNLQIKTSTGIINKKFTVTR